MFYVKLNEGLLFKKLLDCIKDLMTYINLHISSIGISMQAMDDEHISIVSLDLPSESFEIYKCDKSMTLGISVNKLAKILSCIQKDDSLTLYCDYDNKLKIKYENKCKLLFLKFINILLFL